MDDEYMLKNEDGGMRREKDEGLEKRHSRLLMRPKRSMRLHRRADRIRASGNNAGIPVKLTSYGGRSESLVNLISNDFSWGHETLIRWMDGSSEPK